MPATSLDQVVSLCKRRGFIFAGSEIYGGLQGTYDFGPLGVELKNNLKKLWWSHNVYERDDMEGLDCSILMNSNTWVYSGHEETFTDPLVDCKECKQRFRADHVQDGVCPNCGKNNLTEPRAFNLMFKTQVGPVEGEGAKVYLRPETAQGIFVNFKNVLDSTNRKLPFGIAQMGRSFRNEITPRNFIFRVREFEQMEIEYFCKPGTDEEIHEAFVQDHVDFWVNKVGLDRAKITLYEVPKDELAHYSKRTVDVFYDYPSLGAQEIEGIANRSDYDLGSHSKNNDTLGLTASVKPNANSTEKLTYFDHETNKHIVPFCIEPSAGVDRGLLAALCEAYTEETLENGEVRIVLKLKPALSPIKVAVLPLAKNKPDIVAKAKEVKRMLQSQGDMRSVYDDTAAIGKLYRRQDEMGTPFCVTVDYDTIGLGKDGDTSLEGTVTIRDRDTMTQERIAISDLVNYVRERIK